MVGSSADSAVFDFENILPALDFLPIAARRALDHSGLRLSLEAWRSLSLEDRCQLVAAGAEDVVDGSVVGAVVRRARPAAQRIEVVGDPDPLAPPDGLLRLLEPVPLDARQWARLRALDRYALAHVHRRSIARNDPSLIQAAYEDIVMGHLRSLRPPPSEPGATPPLDVPPPPRMPRTDARSSRFGEDTPPHGRVEAAASSHPFDSPPRGVRTFGSPPPRGARALESPSTSRNWLPPESSAAGRPFEGFARSAARAGDEQTEMSARVPTPVPPAFEEEGPTLPLGARAGDVIPELQVPGESSLSSHLSANGDARMVDVGEKPITARRAVASARVHMARETFRRLALHDTPKGDVLAAARIAGIQAAKRTSELIPLCHIVALTSVQVLLDLDEDTGSVLVTTSAQASDRTGVEMEALVAASVAALTIYDMLKGIDREMKIDEVMLLEKSGGRTGHYQRRSA